MADGILKPSSSTESAKFYISDADSEGASDGMGLDANHGDISTATTPISEISPLDLLRRINPAPELVVYRGDFVHATRDSSVQFLERFLIGVQQGKIEFVEPDERYQEILNMYDLKDWEDECVFPLAQGTFMIPGFVNAYAQIVPFLTSWIQDDTQETAKQRHKRKIGTIHNDKLAKKLFKKLVSRSIANGCTCVVYQGSNIESAARLLTDIVVNSRQRALVGMEIRCPENRDDMHMFQLTKVEDFLHNMKRHQDSLVSPCLMLSKPLPEWLEQRVGHIQMNSDVPLMMQVGDKSPDQLQKELGGWVQLSGVPPSCLWYHKDNGLLHKKSIIVNGRNLHKEELDGIKEHAAGMIHCPTSDIKTCQKITDLSALLRKGIQVGLGSDVPGEESMSMLHTIRQCIQGQQLRPVFERASQYSVLSEKVHSLKLGEGCEGNCGMDHDKRESSDHNAECQCGACMGHVSYEEWFRMATLGGATVLGLDDRIGNFEVGKDFDALQIDPGVARSPFVTFSTYTSENDNLQDIFQKFLIQGDDRNITRVYIHGERVK